MAINVDVSRHAGPYTGDASVAAFGFAFKVFSGTHLRVVLTHLESGLETPQTYGTHYSVALNADQDNNPGGTLTMITPPGIGYVLDIYGATPLTQPAVFSDVGGWRPAMLNDALDRLLMQLKENIDTLNSISFPAPADGQLIGWDGTSLANFIATTVSIIPGQFYSQRFSGTGAATSFTLSGTPPTVEALEVFLDGVRQWPGVDYALSGTDLVFVSAPPAGTNNIAARWGVLLSGSGVATTGLTDYDPDKFVDHSAVTITAGVGLSGGGDLTTSRTLDIDIGELTEITTIDSANDFVMVRDATDGAIRKVKTQYLTGVPLGDGKWRLLSDTALAAATPTVAPLAVVVSDDLTRGTFSVSTYRYTATVSCRVLAVASAYVLAVNAGADVQLAIRKNGANVAYDSERDESDATARDVPVSCLSVISLAAGDYVDMTVYSTNIETLEADPDKTYLCIVELA